MGRFGPRNPWWKLEGRRGYAADMFGLRKAPRLALLLLLLGAGAAMWQRRRALSAASPVNAPAAGPAWPPLQPNAAPATAPRPFVATTPAPKPDPAAEPEASGSVANAPGETESTDDAPSATWVAPVDGACPDGYPVKANDNSRIFHVPGGRFYARTVPERCYATAEDAADDGYRRAKA